MGGDYLPFAVCEAYRAPGHPVLPRAVQADRSYAAVRSTGLAHPGRDGEDLAVGAHFRDASEGPENGENGTDEASTRIRVELCGGLTCGRGGPPGPGGPCMCIGPGIG